MPWHESIIESEIAKTKILINATSIGLTADVSPVPAEVLQRGAAGARPDLRQDPPVARCRMRSARRPLDGELMLLHQGAAAFTLWTGQPAPLELMQTQAGRGPRRRPSLGRGRADRRTGGGRRRVTAFRFLTAGESHGPALGVTVEGVPAGLALTEDAIAVDLARRQKGYGRGARQQIEQDRAEILGGVRHGVTLGSPVLLLVRNRDWENWTKVMQVAPLSEEDARELAELAEGGNKRATPVTRVRPGPRRPGRRPQVRLQRRAQRARTRVGPRDRGAGRRRGRRPRVPARARHRGLVVHGGGRRRRGRPGQLHALARGGRRVAAALPGPGRRDGDDRPDRRGARERRHRRRRVRGRRPRPAGRARLVRPLGPPPRRGAGRARS